MSEKQPELAGICPAGVLFEILQYLATVGSNGAGDPASEIGDPRATELALQLEGLEIFDLEDLQIRYRENRVIVRVHCLTDGSLREVEFPQSNRMTVSDRLLLVEDEAKRNRADLLMQARRLEKAELALRSIGLGQVHQKLAVPGPTCPASACECPDGPAPGRLLGYCDWCGLPERGVQIG